MPRGTFNYLQILTVLLKHDVEFIVIGGVCAALHGSCMQTGDLDIVPARYEENLRRLEAALTEMHSYYREHPPGRIVPNAERLDTAGHHLLMTDAGPMDVLGTVSGSRGYAELLPETLELALDETQKIQMLTLPMLIQLKTEANRAKDRTAIPILRQILHRQQNSSAQETNAEDNEN